MILGERMVGMISIRLYPPHLILLVLLLCWVNALLTERYLILLVVVDGCHFFNDAEKEWDCVFRESGARVP